MRQWENFRIRISITPEEICNAALFFYFCVLFAHQQETTVDTLLRYGSFAFVLIAYGLLYPAMKHEWKYRLRISEYEIWMLIFWVYVSLSAFWSLDAGKTYNVLFNMAKVMLVCFLVSLHIDTQKKTTHVMQLLLAALVYMMILLVIRTPFSMWGTERIGEVIGQHSNEVGRLVCLGSLIAFHFFITQKKHRIVLAIFMVIFSACAFLTGSKNALLILVFQFGLYYFLISGNINRILAVAVATVVAMMMYRLIMSNAMLYGLVGIRVERMLAALGWISSSEGGDGSTYERLYFMRTAWKLFKEHPGFGVGLNNFSAYLRKIGYENAVYSHCGFLEILSTLGIVGFIMYYWIYIKTLGNLVRSANKNNFLAVLLFVINLRILLFDISSISLYIYNSYLTLMLAVSMGKILKKEKCMQ